MAAKNWEKYLFNEHRLVALDLLGAGQDLQLLDILVKTDKKRDRLLRHCSPVITLVGSALNNGCSVSADRNADLCGSDDDEEEVNIWEREAAKLKNDLNAFKNPKVREQESFKRVYHGDFSTVTTASSSVLASVASLVNIGPQNARSLSLELSRVRCDFVTRDTREKLFDPECPLWRPNLNKIKKLANPILEKDGSFELWVVTEIWYAGRLIISNSLNVSTAVTADLSVLGNVVSLPIPPKSTELGVTVKKTAEETLTVSGPRVAFGYGALRLVYDSEGNVKYTKDMGKRRPTTHIGRAGSEEDSILDELVDDPISNMGGLFTEISEVLICLDLEMQVQVQVTADTDAIAPFDT